MAPLRLAFFGSPAFAIPALDALLGAGHRVEIVYAQPPRPSGRGQRETLCPVHARAAALGLPVETPRRLRGAADEWARFEALGLDAAVVVAYGLILPGPMLAAPARGCLNIHASLLPRWRGAAPIQAALLAGDDETGVTIMRMDEGLDTGPMLAREAIPIGARETSSSLHDRLAALGARLIVRVLAEEPGQTIQPDEGSTYAPKLGREDGAIDWTRDSVAIDRQIRALTPWPGTSTVLEGQVIKVLAAHPVDGVAGEPGVVLDEKLTVACGSGALRLERVQLPGRGPLEAGAFLRGHRVAAGARLGRVE